MVEIEIGGAPLRTTPTATNTPTRTRTRTGTATRATTAVLPSKTGGTILSPTVTSTPTASRTPTVTRTLTGTPPTVTPTRTPRNTQTFTPVPTATPNPNIGAGQVWRYYYYAGGQRIAMRVRSSSQNQVYYLFSDHLGSLNATVDGNGVLTAGLRYYPFGGTRVSGGAQQTALTFTGQRADATAGMLWIGSRWYDTSLARWAQPDTIVPLESQGVQAWDRYAYTNNSPVKFYDQNGHDAGCGGDCYDYPTVVMRILYNQSNSDADFLVNLYSSGKLGSTPKETTKAIMISTWTAPYQQFNGDYGDSGFKPDLRDGMDQIGHFLTAVRFGEESVNPVSAYLYESLIIGHELIGDDQYTFQGPLSQANHVAQFVSGLHPVSHLLYSVNTLQTDQYLSELNENVISNPSNRSGNSLQDLRLSRLGVQFGIQIESGAFTSNTEAAAWLQSNLCANNGCY